MHAAWDSLPSGGSLYPLAQNQYINNSPGVFSCIRAGANTGAACIRTELIPLRIWQNTREIPPQKYFSCIRASANTGPACIRAKINSPGIFSCMYWFCAGGYCTVSMKICLERHIFIHTQVTLNCSNMLATFVVSEHRNLKGSPFFFLQATKQDKYSILIQSRTS